MKKNVIITGASGNLGKAAVEKFIAEGYQVIATVNHGSSLGYSVDGDIEVLEADLMNEDAVTRIIQTCVNKYKQIDAALLLVGGFAAGNIEKTDGTAIKKMFSLNFDTTYFVARPTFLQMLKQPSGGRIIMIGSRPSLIPTDGKDLLAYALSKSLLFKLADFLNAEGSNHNVITSVIVPSVMDTPSNREFNPNADFSAWVKPEEIAEVMAFLSSNKSRAMRDAVIKMYGNS